MANTVNVSTTTNKVTITPQDTTNVSVGATNTSVTVNQGNTSVVQISSQGPQGARGADGAQGPKGDPGALTAFEDVIITGSLYVSGAGNITASGDISSSGDIYGNIFYGDGSNLTGITTDTGSLLKTASVNLNTLTFTKGDDSTFDITIDTGSGGGSTDTGSLLTTASITDATITFTKGDASTFNIEVDNVTSSISASYILADNVAQPFTSLTASLISASGDITASNLLVYNNTTLGSSPSSITNITGSTYATGTMELNGTMIISGANPGVPPSALQVYGDIQTYGYHRFDPVTTNIDTSTSASYIYVSGSTEDLYFSQNGKGYNNITRLRWLEGNIYTGILNGGVVSATPGGTTFNVAAGEGIIVTLNASTSSLNDGPFPIITLVKWNDLTGITPDYLTTHDTTWLTIDSSGNLVQQTSAPTNGQFDTSIQVGVVLHPNKTTISLAKTFTVTSYGIGQQTYEFIRTFGGIKVSGHAINPSGSSLYINRDPGVSFAIGRNYVNDPNKPSYVEEDGYNSPNLFKYYKSGSTFVTTVGTNTIDPNYYNTPDVGTGLSAVPGGQYSIKRFFYFPNSPNTIGVYYGRQLYSSISTALANLPYEEFEELDNTLTQAIFCGYLIVKGGTTNLSNTSNAKFIQAGTFRNTLSGGGGSTTSNLDALSDVTIGTPKQGQVLRYNSSTSQWINSYTDISGSFTGSITGPSGSFNYVKATSQTGYYIGSNQALSTAGGRLKINASNDLTGIDLVGGDVTGIPHTDSFAMGCGGTDDGITTYGIYPLSLYNETSSKINGKAGSSLSSSVWMTRAIPCNDLDGTSNVTINLAGTINPGAVSAPPYNEIIFNLYTASLSSPPSTVSNPLSFTLASTGNNITLSSNSVRYFTQSFANVNLSSDDLVLVAMVPSQNTVNVTNESVLVNLRLSREYTK